MKKPKLMLIAKEECKNLLLAKPNIHYLEIVYTVCDIAKCSPSYVEMAILDLRKSGHIVGKKTYSWNENPMPGVVHFTPRSVKKRISEKIVRGEQCKVVMKNAADCEPINIFKFYWTSLLGSGGKT